MVQLIVRSNRITKWMQSTFFIALLVINTVHAQSSSVETTIESSLDLQTLILSIPCVEVGADYYSLDLRLITKEPTIDFEVAGFDTLVIHYYLTSSTGFSGSSLVFAGF